MAPYVRVRGFLVTVPFSGCNAAINGAKHPEKGTVTKKNLSPRPESYHTLDASRFRNLDQSPKETWTKAEKLLEHVGVPLKGFVLAVTKSNPLRA